MSQLFAPCTFDSLCRSLKDGQGVARKFSRTNRNIELNPGPTVILLTNIAFYLLAPHRFLGSQSFVLFLEMTIVTATMST